MLEKFKFWLVVAIHKLGAFLIIKFGFTPTYMIIDVRGEDVVCYAVKSKHGIAMFLPTPVGVVTNMLDKYRESKNV